MASCSSSAAPAGATAGARERFWVPHLAAVAIPGELARTEGDSRVYATELGEVALPAAQLLDPILDERAIRGVDDLAELDVVTEKELLHAVRVRYKRDDIYTRVSGILVAVNPFKALPIYSDDFLGLYRSGGSLSSTAAPSGPPGASGSAERLPPHAFAVAADAFAQLADERQSQAVLISGESGAGKSETTKLMLLFASEAVEKRAMQGLEDRILEISPVLEAFGNAKTVRNSNSSRFGKWIEVHVDPISMELLGARVIDYLLEVTRVCSQGPSERNYHIFYQMLSDSRGSFTGLQLGDASNFAYLKANPASVRGINDEEEFSNLRTALAALRFTPEQQRDLFKIVAGILYLGNVELRAARDGAEVADEKGALERVAELWGLSSSELTRCMCFKRRVIGRDTTFSPLDVDKAILARDSIAKLVYGRLFQWLVAGCNGALNADVHGATTGLAEKSHGGTRFFGVLDIAGFESFEKNSLEQLFINLANEKLQQFFNNAVFKTQLAEYKAEGISVEHISFVDNEDILTLIDGKGGLLSLLDDATNGVRQTDVLYASQLSQAHAKHPKFVKPKFTNTPIFGVRHFAGEVTYNAEGMLDKNVGTQPLEILELLRTSTVDVLRDLVAETSQESSSGTNARAGAAKRVATVGAAFRKSLQDLVSKFGSAQAHFVKCIKPNQRAQPGDFQSTEVAEQLRLSGVLEALRIRKAGYPLRLSFEDFWKRFLCILPCSERRDLTKRPDLCNFEQKARALLKALDPVIRANCDDAQVAADFAIGSSKVFVGARLQAVLEMHRRTATAEPARLLQSHFRGWLARRNVKQAREVSRRIGALLETVGTSARARACSGTIASVLPKLRHSVVMDSSLANLDALISDAESLSIELPVLPLARKVRARISAEGRLTREMEDLVNSIDVVAIGALLERARAFGMQGAIIDDLSNRRDNLQAQLPHRVALLDAKIEQRPEMIRETLDALGKSGLSQSGSWLYPDGPELLKAAQVRLEKLELEKKAAAEAKQREAAAVAAAEETARRRTAEIQAAINRVTDAAAAFDATELRAALCAADSLGVPPAACENERQLLTNLQCPDFVAEKLWDLKQREDEVVDFLMLSNLTEQLEVLGCTERPLVDGGVLQGISRRATRLRTCPSFDDADPKQVRAAARCFGRLANLDSIADPARWISRNLAPTRRRGRLRTYSGSDDEDERQSAARRMLGFTAERIESPLTKLDAVFHQAAIRNFMSVLRCMGDKPSSYVGDKAEPVVRCALQSAQLREEVYVQVMKQLTRNPSQDSTAKGWRLLSRLCQEAPPLGELAQFVTAFAQQALQADMDACDGTLKPEMPGELEAEAFTRRRSRKSSWWQAEAEARRLDAPRNPAGISELASEALSAIAAAENASGIAAERQ